MRTILSTATVLLLLCGLSSPEARAETTECTVISSIPTTIRTQGVYCLKGNLPGSLSVGSAITVATNNVTIDLNGYKLGNGAAGSDNLASGIYAEGRKNITVRNGTIRGFFRGIFFYDSSGIAASGGHLLEDLRLEGNLFCAIDVVGSGNAIRRNQILSTGGSTYHSNPYAYGVQSSGPSARIIDNEVINTHSIGATADAIGIYVPNGDSSVITDNRVSEIATIGGMPLGIFYSGDGCIFDSNELVRASGVGYAININGGSTALCSNTRAIGFDGPTAGCADGGGNVGIP
jgi:hypothetical protein